MRCGIAERHAPKLRDTVVMETGGMKGYREEIPKEEFHRILCDAFGCAKSTRSTAWPNSPRKPIRRAATGSAARRGCASRSAMSTTRSTCCRPARAAAEHRRPRQPVVLRLYPDPGRGARRGGRIVSGRGPHRPLRHPRLQPAGTMKYRLKYQECIAVPNAVPTAFRRVCKSAHPLNPAPGGVECCKRQSVATNPLYKLSDSMKTVAFVPIRLNSQRVAGKNLRSLSGSPLMCHILKTLTTVEGIDEVYVFCSDESIRPAAARKGVVPAPRPVARPGHHARQEIYDSFTASVDADLYILAHATSPFIRAATVAGALAKVRSGGIRLGVQRRKRSRLSRGSRQTAQLQPRRHPPHTDHRAGLRRDQRFLHLAGVVVRPRAAHRGPALHGRRRPYRGAGHRLPRRISRWPRSSRPAATCNHRGYSAPRS